MRIFKMRKFSLPDMRITMRLAPYLVASFFICCGIKSGAQTCADPGLLCANFSTDTLSTDDGLPANVNPSFCFADAPNALFFEFNTLNTNQYPTIDYADSTATLFFIIDSCLIDTLFAQGLNIAVFTATNLCDESTYDTPLFCEAEVYQSLQIDFSGLLPATTYYVMVTGIDSLPPVEEFSSCDIRLGLIGPAVEYDLKPEPPNQTIFPGETAEMSVDPAFAPYQWQGEALTNTTLPTVGANPNEVGVYNYTTSTEIAGCEYSETLRVTVIPPIVPYNAFTPNSDGFNDTWVIGNILQWPNAQIVVYSRWGAKVFQATNYQNDWEGDNLPAATYYFVIELNPIEFNTEPITGSVTILR